MPLLEPCFGLASELRGLGLAERARCLAAGQEGRQDGLALHGPIGAAPGDLDGVVERLGQIGEERPHLAAVLK